MNNLNENFKINNTDIIDNCKNTAQPQPSPSQPTTQFNSEPHDFFEEIKREDDTRLMSYSL
ncbi:hypothetical protein DICPUDRAFT_157094 [Dictyostelium purpureum]|uniref:Uncharacterized protein n=1 Tax=Dictyostelium purpureum TaxID=5786 RepID=F0ZY88_DICPU|nr:uncharacterized protein DICPUDRAFT_157094 [Dictyostelium purpureum]EGC31105.1 hypothetical protein DICPUDRAFT_157094 [Dictyostelium purpureum]|eukprot:XP_003292382.1 hypothetical protein DICPUDRAFT_157094 [Dictyostelium purpureum]